ncbi:MAG: AAA family ATPase [Oscillatoriaceae bacterium SKW80]|nr:AAA family ATPase [Oscillatoriaceae bacterium SKYG93]MCX8121263.1 AAA family ATPase [Oscillatoriaceae bacterium SKW80]MDW8453403.1 AAA family ATPase [Oscillatoriaceae cyanobacterium SKYGB_i_bin93]HIK26758.1 AAA family ATPase [Oscillatoriaceae cyanobacterium M7585_C2015_266]
MKLKSIQLYNFCQFYGKTPEIFFAEGEKCNTTIIHGNNGAGKTTLMNAFTWVLYEKFSAAFAAEEQLVNKRALAEAESGKPIVCWVEVGFEHDSKRYQVKRLCRAYRSENGVIEHGKSELYMQVAGDDGRWFPPRQPPEDIIGRILPESLHQYFFFDGERIEKIVRSNNKAEIAEATKELLGVEVLNRAIRHLGEAKKSLETELRGIGDVETKKLLSEKQNKELEREKIITRQNEIEEELKKIVELKKTVNSRLLELSGAEELQRRRNELETQKESLQEQLKQENTALKKAISSRGYAVLLPEIVAEFRSIIEDLRRKGELPVGIKQQFVKDLLEQRQCICGAELLEGTKAYKLVQAWMEKAGMADIEEAAFQMNAQVNEIDDKIKQFWEEVDRASTNINNWRKEISQIETQLDEIKKKLRIYPDEDIQQLQKRLDEIEQKINELHREKGANEQKINNFSAEIEKLSKQIEKQKMNEQRQVIAQRRIAAAQKAIDCLTEVKARLDKQFRRQLEKRVQEIFSQISFTPYVPKLSEKYELTLVENTSGREEIVAASTGENQILSLSFIGGIIDSVREWSKKNKLMGPDTSTFPIVMDSPFGSLDEIYRRQIARIIPKLANQLVVLVTKTQWRGEVEEEMMKYIGREYVLVYNSPKPDCEEDTIELAGMHYPLVRRSPDEFEYTEVVEVDYGF